MMSTIIGKTFHLTLLKHGSRPNGDTFYLFFFCNYIVSPMKNLLLGLPLVGCVVLHGVMVARLLYAQAK